MSGVSHEEHCVRGVGTVTLDDNGRTISFSVENPETHEYTHRRLSSDGNRIRVFIDRKGVKGGNEVRWKEGRLFNYDVEAHVDALESVSGDLGTD